MMSPPSITPPRWGLPGIPSVIIGSSEAPPAAWAAVSRRHHPLELRPLPKPSGFLREALGEGVAHERGGGGPRPA